MNEAGAELAELRALVSGLAAERGLAIGAAGTHPFARWEEQVIVDRPRYRELVDDLGYIARRELIFGTHVHVAIEGADRADLRRRRDQALPAAPARAVHELAVLAGPRHGDDVLARPGLPRSSLARASRRITAPGRSTRTGSRR